MHEVQPASFYGNITYSNICISGPLSSSWEQGQPLLSTSSSQLYSKHSLQHLHTREAICAPVITIARVEKLRHGYFTCLFVL